MLDNSTVTMVVPGGPAYKPVDGKRIEKTDNVLAIDPDGKSGFKAVTPANVVSLLRGPDKVGSHVKLQITKAGSTTPRDVAEFNLVRADFRQVEKIKDVFMKLAELAAAVNAKAPKPEQMTKIAAELERAVGSLNDWTSMVETLLREHVADLEDLVQAKVSQLETSDQALAGDSQSDSSNANNKHTHDICDRGDRGA